MQCDVALIKEQGQSFAVVCVDDAVLFSEQKSSAACQAWQTELSVPVVIIGAKNRKTYGRRDIVKWLEHIELSRLPWQRITLG